MHFWVIFNAAEAMSFEDITNDDDMVSGLQVTTEGFRTTSATWTVNPDRDSFITPIIAGFFGNIAQLYQNEYTYVESID